MELEAEVQLINIIKSVHTKIWIFADLILMPIYRLRSMPFLARFSIAAFCLFLCYASIRQKYLNASMIAVCVLGIFSFLQVDRIFAASEALDILIVDYLANIGLFVKSGIFLC